MVNMCDTRYTLYFNLTTISLVLAAILLGIGTAIFRSNRIARDTHEENICEVSSSSYYESICGGGVRFGRKGPCFIPVWMVTYSIVEKTRINATVEKDGYFSTEEAQNKLDQRQVGMSYSCWCSVIDSSICRWDEPNTFPGMMLVIFGSIVAALFVVGVYFTYGECKKMKFDKVNDNLADRQC